MMKREMSNSTTRSPAVAAPPASNAATQSGSSRGRTVMSVGRLLTKITHSSTRFRFGDGDRAIHGRDGAGR